MRCADPLTRQHTGQASVSRVPYLISALIAAAGAVVLFIVLLRLAGTARRLSSTVHGCRAHLADRVALLAGRIATLRGELDRRRVGSRSAPAA